MLHATSYKFHLSLDPVNIFNARRKSKANHTPSELKARAAFPEQEEKEAP